MSKNYARQLYENPLAESFVINVLEFTGQEKIKKAIDKIVSAELQLAKIEGKTTVESRAYRSYGYQEDAARQLLRETILKELITMERPIKDDDIKIGYGGALPRGIEAKKEKKAFIIIGLPASGKSTIACKIADKTGSIIVDSDFAKRKFPEFENAFGAFLVHEESSAITFSGSQLGGDLDLNSYCVVNGFNMVIPRIGHDLDSILEYAEKLKNGEYEVHLTLVSLDRKKATQRAYKRYLDTGRYVPLSLIFDSYSNEPILTYYRLRNFHKNVFNSFGSISTDVNFDEDYKIIDNIGGNPVELFEKK